MSPQPVQNHAPVPPGNIPKGRQTYIMLGIATVIVLAIVFSGATTKTPAVSASLPPLRVEHTPTKQEIDRYAGELRQAEVQAKAAQAQAEQMKAALRGGASQPDTGLQGGIPGQALIGPDGRVYRPEGYTAPVVGTPPEKSQVVQDKERREITSLFASPIALSLRSSAPAVEASTIPATAPVGSTDRQEVAQALASNAPPHVLFEGTILECVLTNRLTGSFAGPVNCMVTTSVWSKNHTLLIPQGSRALGEAKRVAEQNQQRLAVMFHRIIMPDGYSVNLDQMVGLDQAGATGMKDQTNNHYLDVFGTSIALGLLSGFASFGTGSALTSSGSDVYRQGVASQIAQNNTTVLQRQLNRLPDITIREGQRIRIMLMKDLELPAYAEHSERGDL